MNTVQTNFINSAIKKLFFLISFITIGNFIFAQQLLKPTLDKNNPGSTSNFQQTQKSMEDYWKSQNAENGYVLENGKKSKVPNWKLYKRWEYYWEQRVNQITGEFPTTNSVIEYEKYLKNQNSLNKTAYNESWTNLGTNASGGGYAGLGRINCVAFHPTDANTFWVGSPSGGIWKTTNGGTNWTILNNNQTVIGVSDIIIPSDYATSNTLYIATGDRDGGSMWSLGGGQFNDNNSIGVLKSTDGGTTWNPTGLSYAASSIKQVYRLLIHPANNQILLGSTTDGIYKTTNGGTSWTLKTVNQWIDMEFKPGDPSIICASSTGYGSTYVNRSTDTGESWSLFSVAASGRRGELAVTLNDPTVVYLLAANSGGGVDGVYKSVNSGASFAKVNTNSVTQPGMLGYYTDGRAPATGQGWYDLCIAVDPSNVNTVFIGGITTWKSTDGGVNWNPNNHWTSYNGTPPYDYNTSGAPEVHADKHALVYQNSTTLFEGNDGGIYKTTNGGTNWTDLTNGIIISQIYRIGISQTDANVVLTGLQDNGSKKYIGALNTWVDVTGGDGMECIVDFNNATTYMYATYVNGEIYRNTDGFSTGTTTTISANIPGGQPAGWWVTPYIMNPTNAANLFAGYAKVWKTTNRGDSWTSASQDLSLTTKLRSLAIAPSNTSVLYAADQTTMWKTIDGGATNWTAITLPAVPTSAITYIAVKNTDPSTVWITYGGFQSGEKVYQSTDGGANWTNISAGLPNLPVMSIVQYKIATDRNVLFVGTDVGVYVKDGTNNWAAFNTGLPNVVVTELEILYTGGTNKLRAGTYGRGLWETNIDALLPVELSSFTSSIKNNIVLLNWTTETEVNNYGFEVERSVDQGDFKKIGFLPGHGNSNSPKEYSFTDNFANGFLSYRLKQIDNGGSFAYSDIVKIEALTVNDFDVYQNYPNPFNPITSLKFKTPVDSKVKITITNALGEEIETLLDGQQNPGIHEVLWDGNKYASGVYFANLRINSINGKTGLNKTIKMILNK